MAAFLKLDDIKGEIVLDTTPPELVTVCLRDDAGFKDDALTNGGTYDGGGGTYDGGGGQYVSSYSEDGANRFTTGGGGDSLTDAGLGNNSFHQGADVWTNGSATSIQQDALTNGRQKGEELVSDYWSPTPACDIGETCTPTCPTGFAADALVQQGNDFAGLINPDSMRPAEFFSHNPEWFAPGSAVDSWTEKTFGNGDGEMLGGISQGNVFAPVNVLRGDNRF